MASPNIKSNCLAFQLVFFFFFPSLSGARVLRVSSGLDTI